MNTRVICPHGFDIRMAKCMMCADPAFHAARQPPVEYGRYQFTTYAPNPPEHAFNPGCTPLKQLTEDDVRRIIREELDRFGNKANAPKVLQE